jgi:Fe-S-cluster containining protein
MGDPFYATGLKFTCTRCSTCCRGSLGFVFLTPDDLHGILGLLRLDFHTFFHKYCRLVDMGTGRSISLIEKPGYDCIFWNQGGCSIYEARPIQCSTYPFWASILADPGYWKEESCQCSGIGKGECRNRDYIEARLYARRAVGTIVLPYDADPETLDADSILGR